MIFAPRALGSRTLDSAVLAEDKKTCLRIGPCGIGRKAVYLNSFYIPRCYYVCYEDIGRVFKRVAMSKGGFSQKGPFVSVPYLVVEHAGGQKQCNFKREEKVDEFLAEFGARHPDIPRHSEAAAKKLAEAEATEKRSYVKLAPDEEKTVRRLEDARGHLERRPSLYQNLSACAKDKRARDNQKKGPIAAAVLVLLAALACGVIGAVTLLRGQKMGLYLVLFGLVFGFMVLTSRVLPAGKNSRKAADKRWEDAVAQMDAHVTALPDFPVPARYAHPIVLSRMVRAIKKGRAKTTAEALAVVKEDLKALNSDVRVSRQEYDEVVAIKPMFLVSDYE